jgi:hypothetical protein
MNQKVACILDYFATHPNATIRYHKFSMILYIHSDASYLSELRARSRMGGHFSLSNDMPVDPNQQPLTSDPAPPPNGAIKTNSNIMKVVLASAVEAATGVMFLFLNYQDAIPICVTLTAMCHQQHPPTHVRGDNGTAIDITNNSIKQRRFKAIDMRVF